MSDDIKAKSDALTQSSHKLAEAMYQQASQSEQAAGGADRMRARTPATLHNRTTMSWMLILKRSRKTKIGGSPLIIDL